MPNNNVQFDGQTLIVPGAYYNDNVTAFQVSAPALVPPVVWVVYSYGGVPLTPVTLDTAQDVLNFLRGAPASAMVPFMFSPSSELNGASQVTLIPVGENTQSSITLSDSVPTAVLETFSANYGLPSNLLQIEVSSGSVGGHLITLFDGYSNSTIQADNLGLPMQVAYTGTSTGVTYTITQTDGAAVSFTTTGGHSGENLSIPLGVSGYSTVTELAEYLQGTGFYTAQVTTNGTNGNLLTSLLDAAAAVALPAPLTGVAQLVGVTATLTDIKFWMDNQASSYVSGTTLLVPSAPAVTPVNIPLTHFTGGTSVPPILTDYANGLNVALGIPGWVVIADQNITGLPALLAQHAQTASSITQRRWRRAVSGSNIGDSISTVSTMARDLNAKEMTYVYPGMFRNDPNTGVNTLYGGFFVAAAVAGMMAGNPIATPLTNKTLTGNGVEFKFRVDQIDSLQQAGVMPVFVPDTTGVPTVCSDLTTWQNDNNPENVYNQQVACRQYLAYVMYGAEQPYIGQIESSFSILNQKQAAIRALNGQIINATGDVGVLNSWNHNSLVLNYNGAQQLTSITFDCTFVGQNRFTTITAYVQPLNLTA
jgi:hypothetical protein